MIEMRRWFVVSIISLLLAGSIATAVFLWPRQAGVEYPRHSSWPSYVSISADGNYIAAVCSMDGDVLLFSRTDNNPLWSSTVEGMYGVGHDITESVSISSDGSYIAVGGRGNVYLYNKDNVNKDNVASLWSANVGGADGIQISSDGNYIAAFYGDLNFFLKDNNSPLWSYSGVSFAMSDTGNYLALTGDEASFLFAQNGVLLWSFSPDEDMSPAVVDVSSDGDFVTMGTIDGKLYLLGNVDNTPIWVYSSNEYLEPAISADGNYIVAADSGGGSYLGEPIGGELYFFNRTDNVPIWNTSWPCFRPKVAISSDGDYFIVGEWYGKLSLFSRESSTPLWTYQFPKNIWVSSVSMSADGQYIAVGTGGMPGPNIATSIYLFSKDSNQPLWVYYHEVEPYGYA